MLGLRRRKRVEGWAVDVAEYGSEETATSLRERLAASNKLWLLSLVVVVGIGLALLSSMGDSSSGENKFIVSPKGAGESVSVDKAHLDFARSFRNERVRGGNIYEAEFRTPNLFRIVVPADVGQDDIDYISKMAAWKILRTLHHQSIVVVYTRRAADGGEVKAATTSWKPSKFGFVVRYENRGI